LQSNVPDLLLLSLPLTFTYGCGFYLTDGLVVNIMENVSNKVQIGGGKPIVRKEQRLYKIRLWRYEMADITSEIPVFPAGYVQARNTSRTSK
jgi:hypothetical protein